MEKATLMPQGQNGGEAYKVQFSFAKGELLKLKFEGSCYGTYGVNTEIDLGCVDADDVETFAIELMNISRSMRKYEMNS